MICGRHPGGDLASEDAGQKLKMDRGKCAHLVNKDGAEIADYVDDAKDEDSLGEHSEVGAAHVTIHREHVCHLVQIFPYLQPQPHPASVPFFPQTLSDSVGLVTWPGIGPTPQVLPLRGD